MLLDSALRSIARLRSMFRNLFGRADAERDLDAELGAYLDLLTEENMQRGMTAAEARRSALLTLGGLTQVKEQTRDVQAGVFLETLLQDVRYAGRIFGRSPTFFVVAVFTIALGIGVTTALFSIVNAVLLRSLPYPDASRLAFLGEGDDKGHPGFVSYPDFDDWRTQNHSFEYMAAYGDAETSVSNGDSAIRTHVAVITQEFFKTFGTLPAIGRDFSPVEHRPGAATSVLISDSLWRGMFGSSPGILGRTIKLLGGIRCTIIGVMPADFDFPMHSQLWAAAELTNDGLHERTAHNFQVVGKLKPGIPISIAQQDISTIARRIKNQFPGTYQASDAQVIPLRDQLMGPYKPSLLTLFAAVGFVLLIVCVNVANLLLARGAARAHELAIRGALGAARARLIRQLIVESLALAIAGGAAGIVLAWWTLHILKFFVPVNIPRIETVNMDSHVFAFAALVSMLSGLLFGIVPAFAAARIDVNETLKQASIQHTATRGTRRIGNLLVISEIALAFMLLIGTGLLVRSFEHLRRQPAGFEPANVLTAALSFPVLSLNWNVPPDRLNNYQSIAAGIRLIPGVRVVAYSSALPLTGDPRDGHFSVEGIADLPGFLSDAKYRVISPDYFRAIGTRLLAGRFFSDNDGPNTMPVVIINSIMARTVFPNGQALGRRIWFDSFDPERRYMTIVGIVDDIREDGLNRPAQAAGYVCYAQHQHHLVDTNLVVKVASDPIRFAPALRKVVRSVNKDVPVTFDTLGDIYARSISRQRFEAQMLGVFAWIAILLAGVGIYGVLSYLVQQTRSEIGIRMALGASSRRILSSIVSRGLRAALFGVIVGIPGILVIARLLSSMLYNVSAFDPFTYLSAGILLFSIVLIASYVPAKRATRIEPVAALKYE